MKYVVYDGKRALQDFIFTSKYSKQEGTHKETYGEAVTRVMGMHSDHLRPKAIDKKAFDRYFGKAYGAYYDQKILGAQRSLQFGGAPMLKHMMRTYNCTSSYVDRLDFFKQLMYIGLCGAGAGYSVHPIHVNRLPSVRGAKPNQGKVFVVEDSIEGWADAVDQVIKAHFFGMEIPKIDVSGVRPKGAFISGGFKAPGPEPLVKCLNLLDTYLKGMKGRKIRPFEAHLLACTIADAVISGGVRRSALIVLFAADDEEMLSCKTGDWWSKYPQLARANNSAIILPDTPKETYERIFNFTKQYGEPGFAFLRSVYHVYNPCFEVGMVPSLEIGNPEMSGWSTCNLTEINGSKVKTGEDFVEAAKNASILGTFQAAYTDFPYLGWVTEEIVRRDALIGVGITGMASNPDILFDPEWQRKAAQAVVDINKQVAEILGINAAARTTVIKPSGNSSQMLGTSSGIHPFHSKRYIRNVQVNKEEQAGQFYVSANPFAAEDSSYNQADWVISFPVELDDNVLTKDALNAQEFMELVKITQDNWINYGTNLDHETYKNGLAEGLTHNVSNTITVAEDEWDTVKEYLWDNSDSFCGISFLRAGGDLDYAQSPYIEVLDEVELAKEYGKAAILAGGLIVDGLHAFNDNLYAACDTAIGSITGNKRMYSQDIKVTPEIISDHIRNGLAPVGEAYMYSSKVDGVMVTDVNAIIGNLYEIRNRKEEWIRRFEKFANRYLDGDLMRTATCLKRVSMLHKWAVLQNTVPVDYAALEWKVDYVDADTLAGQGCYGGLCEV